MYFWGHSFIFPSQIKTIKSDEKRISYEKAVIISRANYIDHNFTKDWLEYNCTFFNRKKTFIDVPIWSLYRY